MKSLLSVRRRPSQLTIKPGSTLDSVSMVPLRVLATVSPRAVRNVAPVHLRAPLLRLISASVKRCPRDFLTVLNDGTRLAGNTRDVVQRYLYVFGIWEPSITAWLLRHLREGDVAVDVGANIGYYTLVSAKRVGPSGSVIACEPLPASISALERNLRLNGVHNAVVHNVAAASREDVVKIWQPREGVLGDASTRPTVAEGGVHKVRAMPLADLIPDPERVRLIKIDVEGDELAALAGLESAMHKLPTDCAFMVEVTPAMLALRGHDSRQVFHFFEAHGFHSYRVENRYDPWFYARLASPSRPVRCRVNDMSTSGDFVFSRLDHELL